MDTPNEVQVGDLLAARLDEGPVPTDQLWRLFWGEDREGSGPDILRRLERGLLTSGPCAHVLISGRYGSGKTSFIDALRDRLGRATPTPRQLLLHMPLITAHTGTSPVAAVIGAIVEQLCATPPPGADERLCRDLMLALDDLWQREAGCAADCESPPEHEGPRPNRLAGTPTQLSTRVYRANTIEQSIDRCLGWQPDTELQGQRLIADTERPGQRLIVYLDDVDRCHRRVPAAIIRLLLRFGTTRGVRFVVTCDRDLMARGVEEWMQANGTDDGGHVFVTANSALEKYLNLIVDIPSLDKQANEGTGAQGLALDERRLNLLSREVLLKQGAAPQPILRPWPGANRAAFLAEHLLTWLLSVVEEKDLLRSSADEPSQPLGGLQGPRPREVPPTPTAEPLSESPPGVQESLKIEGKAQHKDEKEQAPTDKIFRSPLTSFADGLRALVDLDQGSQILRLRQRYVTLICSLTPRQLKFYLRALLSGTLRDEGSPAVTLLKQVFFAFYRLRYEEWDLFRFVAASAAAAVGSPGARESSRALALCYDQVRAIAAASSVLKEDGLAQVWPMQHEEQALLLRLLAVIREEDAEGEGTGEALAGDLRGGGPSFAGGPDRDFADWVREKFGKAPVGDLVADQVSSFQDYALDAYRRGESGVSSAVAEYATRFLPRHGRYLAQKTATSLSNLAVLINHVEPYEPQCNQLFDAAIRLSPEQSSIPLYYAEFLATVAVVPARLARLVPDHYPDRDALLERAQRLVAAAPTTDPKGRFYGETIGLRIAKARGAGREDLIRGLDELVTKQIGLFAEAARSGDSEPLSRLDSTMDTVLGKGAAELPLKRRIFGLIWGVLQRCGLPAWSTAQYLANNLVGQSKEGSPDELSGLRINLGLLIDVDLIAKQPSQVSPIWTQTLAFWSRRAAAAQSDELRARAALGLLAALVYGGGRNWAVRANEVWNRFGGADTPDPDTLLGSLDAGQEKLLRELQDDRTRAEPVVIAVFDGDLRAPITSVESLAEEEYWPDWGEIENRIAVLAKQQCPERSGDGNE